MVTREEQIMIWVEQALARALDAKWRGAFVEEDTSAVDLHAVTCSDCGEPMDTHGCPGSSSAAGATTIVRTRSTGPRKKATDHPACPFCGGRVHWNNGQSTINHDCMYKQYLMDKGLIATPYDRLPIFTAQTWIEATDWIKDRVAAGDFQYGNMASAAGGATYSARKPKAAPRPKLTDEEKKEKAAARRKAAKSITDVATEVAEEDGVLLEGSEPFGDTEADQVVEETPAPVTRSRRPRGRELIASATASRNGDPEADANEPADIETRRNARRAARAAKLAAIQGK